MVPIKAQLRRLRFARSLLSAYAKRYRVIVGLVILAIFILAIGLFTIWPNIIRSNVLAIGYVGVFQEESIPQDILTLATEPLIAIDASGKPQPSLASHWTVSQDGKTYIVFLKDNLKWHDGTVVDAKDITIAIGNVEITALNNKAIEFKLPNPITSFPTALNLPVFKYQSYYGTGQFRIVKIDTFANVVRRISLVPKNKQLPNVDIKFYDNEIQAQEALKIGEVKSVKINSGSVFENWPNFDISKKIDESRVVTIFFNTQDPILSQQELRQALNFAINRADFNGPRALGPISPQSWAYNSQVKRYEYNTGKAKELLSKSNLADTAITLAVAPGLEPVAENIKRDWEAVGVKTILVMEKTVPKKFQALLATNLISPDPDQYGQWHSAYTQTTNITQYKNVKIDKLLEDGRLVNDLDARRQIYFDFQRFLTEDCPAIFLYHPQQYQITYKNAKELLSKLPL